MKLNTKLITTLLLSIMLVFLIAAAPSMATRYFRSNVVIDGVSDAIQLRVQGWTTQTNQLLTLEQSDGTDVLTVTNDGGLSLDGQADAIQLRVQGWTTQTNQLLTLEQSDGTDVLTVTNAGALAFSGDVTIGGLSLEGTTTFTATDGQTITPTVTYYLIDAAGAVTITLEACSNTGQPLYLAVNDAITVTIADTNIRTTDGNAVAIDQYDVVQWRCNGAEWWLVADSSNQ